VRTRDTIFALASGRPPAGIAVVRISGPLAHDALAQLTGRPVPRAARAVLRELRHPSTGAHIDHALVLCFTSPASFTGEHVVELHLHGGRATVAAALDALSALSGLRAAEAGEFTRRAFENGRIDLTQAEGLADLIAADTEAQRQLALSQADGHLHRLAERWADQLLRLLADAEAVLDFAEEEAEVGEASLSDRDDLAALAAEISGYLASAHVGERVREGFIVAVVGAPNAGKSTLLNKLVRRDAAIVSDVPGTTRDMIEAALDIGGLPFVLVDTAGLRQTADAIEAEGVRRALARARSADLVLHVFDQEIAGTPLGQPVVNKVDLTGSAPGERDGVLHISAESGAGLRALEDWLERWGRSAIQRTGAPLLSRPRQREALAACSGAIQEALEQSDPVLHAEALRLAVRALGRLTGKVDVEQLLDSIFSRFCIGK
jgi:tRNA modification GTPase